VARTVARDADVSPVYSTSTMTRPWHAEHPITPELARSLIRARFPGVAAERVEPLGSGWDNTAFLVDGTLVFRFPHKPSAAALLETEARVLPAIAPRLPLAVPNPRWVGEPDDAFPWSFVGYPMLPGRPACTLALAEEARAAAAPVLGEFLARLHAIPTAGLPLPGDTLDRTNFHTRMPLLEARLAVLAERGAIADAAPWLALFRQLPDAAPARAPVLVHGDLYACHLLVDERGAVSGVIDWGDVHAGDRGVDLMLLYAFLPPSAREVFLRAYGAVDARDLRVARLRAAFHSVSLAWSALERGDDAVLAEALLAMRFALEE